jgi:glutathione S-transferase
MELVVFENCPFCHRCLLALAEKDATFKLLPIDQSAEKASAHLLSPYARVPVLWHEGRPIFESSIINEYLEEILPAPALLPQDAAQRAMARFWIDFCNTRFMPAYFNLLKERSRERRAPLKAALVDHLRFIETTALTRANAAEPYWMGQAVTLVDYAFYPFFERFVSVEIYRGVTISADLERVHAWLKTMQKRDAVRQLARSRDYYVEYFGEIYADH